MYGLKPVPFEPKRFAGYLTLLTLMKKPTKQRLIFLNETITDRTNKVTHSSQKPLHVRSARGRSMRLEPVS